MEIQGYENYLIYEDGRVWSKRRKRFMKPQICKSTGYYKLQLCKNGKHKCVSIHRLIGLYYIPNPNNKPEVDHINRIRTDNRIENLRWATREEQMNNTKLRIDNILGKAYISVVKRSNIEYYLIRKHNYFCKYLNCSKYTLQDAIKLRDELLIINNII